MGISMTNFFPAGGKKLPSARKSGKKFDFDEFFPTFFGSWQDVGKNYPPKWAIFEFFPNHKKWFFVGVPFIPIFNQFFPNHKKQPNQPTKGKKKGEPLLSLERTPRSRSSLLQDPMIRVASYNGQ
jgi:hypothetical protein